MRPRRAGVALQTKRPFPCGNNLDDAMLRFDLGRLAQRDDIGILDTGFYHSNLKGTTSRLRVFSAVISTVTW